MWLPTALLCWASLLSVAAVNLPTNCKTQVACNTTINFFKREIDSWPRHNPSLTALFDTNHDDRVYIEEVYNKLRDYARMAFTVLDEDKDGSLANEADAGNILKKFSTEFFKKVLAIAFDYFDSNNDNIVDQSDAFFMDGYEERGVFRRYLDRNWDGHVALSEALHVPSLYHIPGPFYGLYSRIDKNLDEKLTLEEATNATINLFSLVDSDSDCYVTPAEVIAMLDDVGLLWDYQLAVNMFMHKYLALGQTLAKMFIARADADQDNRVTFDELEKFSDFDFVDSVYRPLREVVDLFDFDYPERSFRLRRGMDDYETEALLFTALQNLTQNPVFLGAPRETTCTKG